MTHILSLAQIGHGHEFIGMFLEVMDVLQLLGERVHGNKDSSRDNEEDVNLFPHGNGA